MELLADFHPSNNIDLLIQIFCLLLTPPLVIYYNKLQGEQRLKLANKQRDKYYQTLSRESSRMEKEKLEQLEQKINLFQAKKKEAEALNVDDDIDNLDIWSGIDDSEVEKKIEELEELKALSDEVNRKCSKVEQLSRDVDVESLDELKDVMQNDIKILEEQVNHKCPSITSSNISCESEKLVKENKGLTRQYLAEVYDKSLEIKTENLNVQEYVGSLVSHRDKLIDELNTANQKVKVTVEKYEYMRQRLEETMKERYERNINYLLSESNAQTHYDELKKLVKLMEEKSEFLNEKIESLTRSNELLEQDLKSSKAELGRVSKELKRLQEEKELPLSYRDLGSSLHLGDIPPPPPIACPVDEFLNSANHNNQHFETYNSFSLASDSYQLDDTIPPPPNVEVPASLLNFKDFSTNSVRSSR